MFAMKHIPSVSLTIFKSESCLSEKWSGMQAAQMCLFSNVFTWSKNKDFFCLVLLFLSSLVAFWSLPKGPSLVTIKDFHLIWLLAQNWPLLMPSFEITVKLTMPQIAFSKEHLCLQNC